MKIIVYEDNPEKFYPLINLYPQFNLRIGMKSIVENITCHFPNLKVEYLARDLFKLKKIAPAGPILYLSGRSIITKKFIFAKDEVKLLIDSEIAGFIKYKPPFPKNCKEIDRVLKTIKKTQKLSGFILNNIWDMIKYNEAIMHRQFKMIKGKGKTPKGINVIGDRKNLFIDRDAEIHKFTCFDMTEGPVYIDRAAVIRPFTTIVGPSYIGPGTVVDCAKITKSSIGPGCRIGGEVEVCIFQGYANKYHNGFIGHSFIGEWVNLGALTTNSNLKNNYRPVRIKIGKKEVNSGMIKLGCFVGDHTKTGIGTLIPTGAVIGSFVNFFGGGMIPRYVSCFEWLTTDEQRNYDLKKAIETARVVMQRRNIKMSPQYENLIRASYKWRDLS